MSFKPLQKLRIRLQNRWAPARGRLVRHYFIMSLLLISGGLITSGLLEIYFRYQESYANVSMLQQALATTAAVKTERFIYEIENMMRITTKSREIARNGLSAGFQPELTRLLLVAPAIEEVSALDLMGRVRLQASRFRAILPHESEEVLPDGVLATTARGAAYFGEVYFVRGSEPYSSIAVPIEPFAGNVIGVLWSKVNLKYIWEMIQDIKIGQSGYAYIVARSGDLVAHPDLSLVLRRQSFRQFEQVEKAFKAKPLSRERESVVTTSFSGARVFASYALIPKLNWAVIIEQPLDEAYAPLYRSMYRTTALLLIGLFLALLASVFVARRVVRPLEKLRAGVEQIRERDTNFQIELKTGDEIEGLAEEFNKMARQRRVMNQLTRALASELTLTAVCNEFVEGIKGYIPFDRVLIGRLHADDRLETFFFLSSLSGETLERSRESDFRSTRPNATEWVVREGKPFIREDTAVQREFGSDDRLAGLGIRSYILVPLFLRGRLVGRLSVGSKQPKTYDDHDAAFLLAASEWLAIAIENARLYEQQKHHAAELERKVLERTRELVNANDRLKELDRIKSHFLSNVSHELRTPLAAIEGWADNMLDGVTGVLTNKQVSYVTGIKQSTERLERLINDLLDLSVIEAGKTQLRPTGFSMTALLQDVANALTPMANEKHINFEIAANNGHLNAWADRDKMTQVLTNLVGNAIKFSPQMGTVTMSVSSRDDSVLEISVTDEGPGIPEEQASKIFDEFYQLAQPGRKKSKGVGLGLAISKKLVEMHGGKIRVESSALSGSTFSFTVPTEAPVEINTSADSEKENGITH